MVKRVLCGVLLCSWLLLFSACGFNRGGKYSPVAQQGEDGTFSYSALESAVPNEEYEPFYGSWKVTEFLAFAPVSALSREDVQQYLGTTITYDKDCFSCKGNIANPHYKKEVQTAQDFATGFHEGVHFADLGITQDSASAVSIENRYDFGTSFYWKDNNNLVIVYDGAFFAAVRENDG